MDLETDPEMHTKLDSELDPDAGQSALRIVNSWVPFATGLPQFYNKLRNSQACGFPLSNFYCWLQQSAVRKFSLWQSAEFTPRIAKIRLTHLSAELRKE
jgi:hypothetical protein